MTEHDNKITKRIACGEIIPGCGFTAEAATDAVQYLRRHTSSVVTHDATELTGRKFFVNMNVQQG